VTTSDPDPLAFLRSLQAPKIEPAADAVELGQRSVLSAVGQGSDLEGVRELTVRLAGEGVVGNAVEVRTAATILTGLQEVFSAIGQTMRGAPTARGAIPFAIRRETELFFSAPPSPGSIQFHLQAATGYELGQLPGMAPAHLLIDQVAVEFLSLVGEAESATPDPEVLGHLRRLGPRVARQVSLLTTGLVEDSVDLDLTWRQFGHAPQRAFLRHTRASLVRDVIARHHIDVQEVVIVGRLVTISTVSPAALVLPNGRVVSLDVDRELARQLAPLYEHRVRAAVQETTVSTEVGARGRPRYRLIDIRAADSEDVSDPDF
jgi:hypothetical protein